MAGPPTPLTPAGSGSHAGGPVSEALRSHGVGVGPALAVFAGGRHACQDSVRVRVHRHVAVGSGDEGGYAAGGVHKVTPSFLGRGARRGHCLALGPGTSLLPQSDVDLPASPAPPPPAHRCPPDPPQLPLFLSSRLH